MISMIAMYIVIYIAYNKLVVYYAPSIFEKKVESTHFVPVSNALVLRICAEKEANIDLFENYMLFRMKEDPNEVIEVLRFLGIFKSFRSQLLMMLSMKKCDDSYYNYQFYAFARVFKSYLEPTPQNYIVNLDQMHRSYLVNLSLYWNNRYNGNRFQTLIHGINTAVLHVELISFIKYLCVIYQYDPYIIQSYSEIALVAMGQPKLSAYYKHHFNKLIEHSKPIIDPIFKKMSHYYPISLERYMEETKRSNGDSYNADISYSFESTALRFHVDDNTIYRDSKSDSSVTAMFVTKNTKLSSFGLLINILLTFVWSGFFIKFDTGDMKNFKNEVIGVYNSLYYFNNLSENLTTGIILPQLLVNLNYEHKFDNQQLYYDKNNIKIPNKESDQNIDHKSDQNEIKNNIMNNFNLENIKNVNQKENTETNFIHQISRIYQNNYIDSSNCSKHYYMIYGETSNYLTSIRNDYNYYVKILSELSIYLTGLVQTSGSICEPLTLLTNNFSYLTFEILNEFSKANSYLNGNMTEALDYLKDVSTVNFFIFLLVPSVFLGSLVIFLVVFFHLRFGLREIRNSEIFRRIFRIKRKIRFIAVQKVIRVMGLV
ncbi:hypothetical protein TVAG_042260 [Trichomonas vaginalis G3]|uniref:Uncharacterized protein n=1 Tax=Trichomonas vaginalis (strain ATCC PRA-98 / G3) TaxID=412133 RepID=A2EUW5_TRIV3|nr:hypothetical protein TVAGG3_0192480 [Trichomonas vaginalis G3]EAY03574.1 hypothetical protein TVAG_042260 [Trichomonas vaginalis G3]KAI5550080.1 hypothetical protein TVAGG3_0192480 [Trichomonas vaginalis G3]|eukprot:XP_001315797.1 hypothetical protein [Trichomonas vaginalis G3]